MSSDIEVRSTLFCINCFSPQSSNLIVELALNLTLCELEGNGFGEYTATVNDSRWKHEEGYTETLNCLTRYGKNIAAFPDSMWHCVEEAAANKICPTDITTTVTPSPTTAAPPSIPKDFELPFIGMTAGFGVALLIIAGLCFYIVAKRRAWQTADPAAAPLNPDGGSGNPRYTDLATELAQQTKSNS